jgi:hypothetical protein
MHHKQFVLRVARPSTRERSRYDVGAFRSHTCPVVNEDTRGPWRIARDDYYKAEVQSGEPPASSALNRRGRGSKRSGPSI